MKESDFAPWPKFWEVFPDLPIAEELGKPPMSCFMGKENPESQTTVKN